MKGFSPGRPTPGVLRQTAVAALALLAFVGAYYSTVVASNYTPLPPNLWLGGEHGLQLRPEPVVIPVALAFGWPAIMGASLGVLVHNLLFRIAPGGITLAFSLAQTLVVAVGGYVSLILRNRVPRPYDNLVATWTLSAFVVLILGAVAAMEYGTTVFHEWDHILREVLLPINVFGLLILELLNLRKVEGAKTPRGGD